MPEFSEHFLPCSEDWPGAFLIPVPSFPFRCVDFQTSSSFLDLKALSLSLLWQGVDPGHRFHICTWFTLQRHSIPREVGKTVGELPRPGVLSEQHNPPLPDCSTVFPIECFLHSENSLCFLLSDSVFSSYSPMTVCVNQP